MFWQCKGAGHGIDPVLPEYFGLSIRRVNLSYFIEPCSTEFHVISDNSDFLCQYLLASCLIFMRTVLMGKVCLGSLIAIMLTICLVWWKPWLSCYIATGISGWYFQNDKYHLCWISWWRNKYYCFVENFESNLTKVCSQGHYLQSTN